MPGEDHMTSRAAESGSAKPRRQALVDLLERVNGAEGADRELDGAIYSALECIPNDGRESVTGESFSPVFWPHLRESGGAWLPSTIHDAPGYTGSLDTALALLGRKLPGWRPFIESRGAVPGHEWRVQLRWWEKRATAWGRSAPRAVIASLLTALLAQEEDA